MTIPSREWITLRAPSYHALVLEFRFSLSYPVKTDLLSEIWSVGEGRWALP